MIDPTRLDPGTQAVLLVSLVAGAWLLGLAALGLLRLRVPAFLHGLAPAAVVGVGVATGLRHGGEVERALAFASPATVEAMSAAGWSESAMSLWVALIAAGMLCALSAPLLALTTIARAGEGARATPKHAAAALLAVPGALIGIAAGPLTALAALSGAVAIGIASVRLGKGPDLKRLAAGRALVGSFAAAGPALLLAGHVLRLRADWLGELSAAPWIRREQLLADPWDGLALVLVGDLGALLFVGVAGVAALAPVVAHLVDGRSSVGTTFAVFVLLPPLIGAPFVALPLWQFTPTDPVELRQRAWIAQGLELVELEGLEPWQPAASTLEISVYWATRDGERIVPIRGGRVSPSDLDERGAAKALLDAGLPPLGAGLNLEIDRRATSGSLQPFFRAIARGWGGASIPPIACLVARNRLGRPGCVNVSLADPREAATHLLIQPESLVLIDGEQVTPFDLDADAARLQSTQVAVHAHPTIGAQRLIDALHAVARASGQVPLIVAD